MAKIYLSELSAVLAEKHGVDRRTAQHFVNSVVDVIHQGLEQDRIVKVRGLGTFKIVDVEARKSVNVNTGEEVVIDSHSKLTFLPEASLKELVNKPFALFETVLLNEGVSFSELDDEEDMDIDNIDESALASEVEEPVVEEVDQEKPAVEEPVHEKEPVQEVKPAVIEEEEPVVVQPAHVEEPIHVETPVVEEEEEPVIVQPVHVKEPYHVEEPVHEQEPAVEEEEETIVVEPAHEQPAVEEKKDPFFVEPVHETEPVHVEEPVHETEPVHEEEPTVEEEEEPVIVDPVHEEKPVQEMHTHVPRSFTHVDEPPYSEDSSDDDEDSNEEKPKRRRGLSPVLAGALLVQALLVGGGLGFLIGRNTADDKKPSDAQVVQTVEKPSTIPAEVIQAPSETQLEVTQVEVTQPGTEQQPEKVVTPEPQPMVTGTEEPIWEKYNDMDPRMRNGYYYIMGLDHMEKVRAGDNVARISKRVWGASELACYIEVFNGIDARTALEPDTEIKIPKIEVKKVVRKRLQQQNNNNNK